MDPAALFLDASPIGSPFAPWVALHVFEARPEGAALVLTLRLLRFDATDPDDPTIEDIIEQEVRVGAAELADPRLPAFIEGWREALLDLFAAAERTRGLLGPSGAMPCELLPLDVLRLKRPQSASDFADALLRGRGRLGRFLPAP